MVPEVLWSIYPGDRHRKRAAARMPSLGMLSTN